MTECTRKRYAEMKKKALFAILFIVAGMALAGCGKMSPPETYEGSGYPHSYPRR